MNAIENHHNVIQTNIHVELSKNIVLFISLIFIQFFKYNQSLLEK